MGGLETVEEVSTGVDGSRMELDDELFGDGEFNFPYLLPRIPFSRSSTAVLILASAFSMCRRSLFRYHQRG